MSRHLHMESYSFEVLLSNASQVLLWIYRYSSRWSYEFCVQWALVFLASIPGRYHRDVKRHVKFNFITTFTLYPIIFIHPILSNCSKQIVEKIQTYL